MTYTPVTLKKEIEISEIVTVHYFEYGSTYSYSGEAHNFWEFLCVDKGEVEVVADTKVYQLTRGDVIFHKPNEFHRLTANKKNAPNLVVVSFFCHSPAMNFFENKLLHVDSYEREQLARVIAEASAAFQGPLDNPLQTHMELNPEAPFACGQLLCLHLELFLLHLLRKNAMQKKPLFAKTDSFAKEAVRRQNNEETYSRILEYISLHLHEPLSIERIARDNLIGTSRLQQLIRERHGCGVIDFVSQQKIKEAKQLIRDEQLNFTEIADVLGYSSIHYFSRQFKKLAGMTPSEYSSSIKRLSEDSNQP